MFPRAGYQLGLLVVFVLCLKLEARDYAKNRSEKHEKNPPPPPPPPSPASTPPPCEDEATIQFDFIREGNTYNDPSDLLTPSWRECCRICRDDPKCESWTRDDRTKACALKGTVVELRRNDDFDSGVIGGSPATQGVPIDDRCLVEGSVDFVGDDMRDEDSADAQECCRMCEEDLSCFSWTRVRSSGRCFLKSGVPGRVTNSDADGGTVF